MICCPVNITPFFNEDTTTIPFTGDKPIVQVIYFQDGQWTVAGVFTEVKFSGSNIIVNHGGPATGRVILK